MEQTDIFMDESVSNQPVKKSFFSKISEDGWALWIGGMLIAAVLAIAFINVDFKFGSPVYQWSDINDLSSKVFSGKNLSVILYIGLVFAFLSTVAVWLSGQSARRYFAGVIVILILALVSLTIAGNKWIAGYGIEYVVFGLIIGLLLSNFNLAPSWLKEAARSEFFIK